MNQGPPHNRGDKEKQALAREVDADIARPRGGRRAKTVAEHPLQCQQVNSEPGLFMELQPKKFCQLHALKALFGGNIVQPHAMLDCCASCCCSNIQRDIALGKTVRNMKYEGNMRCEGNFPDMVVNAWLHYNCQPAANLKMKCIIESNPCNSSETAFIAACLPSSMHLCNLNQGG